MGHGVCCVLKAPMARPRWDTVSVYLGSGSPALEGDIWLAALFRWLRQESPSWVTVTGPHGDLLGDPRSVNWDQFPLEGALEAVRTLAPHLKRLIEVVRQEPPPRMHSPSSIARLLKSRGDGDITTDRQSRRSEDGRSGAPSSRRGTAGMRR